MSESRDILKIGNISLLLEGYDDIFSDFDPRPYRERTISDDFLNEAQKVVHEAKSGSLEIEFLVPKKKRSLKSEKMIKERLHEHFRLKKHELSQEKEGIRRRGIILVTSGFILMMVVSTVYSLPQTNFWLNALRAIMEPGGWFMSWYGLDLIFYLSTRDARMLKFYNKMTHSIIQFQGY